MPIMGRSIPPRVLILGIVERVRLTGGSMISIVGPL